MQSYDTLISVQSLAKHLDQPDWLLVDTCYDLKALDSGYQSYLRSHIHGAVFADLKHDLSSHEGLSRHPMPTTQAMVELFQRLGINQDTQVVVYDDDGGSFAARLWWMLRYMGHHAVAVLDGGWSAWQAEKLPVQSAINSKPKGNFIGSPITKYLVTIDQVTDHSCIIDSRHPSRYSGESEPIDPIGGHIPNAINRCWQHNLDQQKHFKSTDKLSSEFSNLLGSKSADEVVFYCGSGVTACHNILAAVHVGLQMPKLYAGSWSEWSRTKGCQVVTGET